MKKRVVVTGLGMITPIGLDTESSWEGLVNGKSGIGPITQFDDKAIPTQIAGEIHGFEPEKYIEPKEIKKMDRFIHLAIAASQMAMDDSGLKITPENAERIGVIVSAGMGGLPAIEKVHDAYRDKGSRRITPFFIPMTIINEAAGVLSIRYGAKGPNLSIVTALRHRDPFHRRRFQMDPARRRRCHDRRRNGSVHLPARGRRIQRHEGPVHEERRTAAGQPSL